MTGSGRRLPSVVSFPFGSFWKRFCTVMVIYQLWLAIKWDYTFYKWGYKYLMIIGKWPKLYSMRGWKMGVSPIPFMYAWFTSVRTQQSKTKQNKKEQSKTNESLISLIITCLNAINSGPTIGTRTTSSNIAKSSLGSVQFTFSNQFCHGSPST